MPVSHAFTTHHLGTRRGAGAADPDAQLMLSAKRGDSQAMEALINRHRTPVTRYIYRFVRDYAVSEELTQEVFLRVHRHRDRYEVTARFTTWLYRIAGHLALNWIRDHEGERRGESLEAASSGHAHRQFPDSGIGIDEWLIRQRRLAEVRRVVNELPDRQRTVVVLHKFNDVGCERIAATLGCSHQAVRSLLCRAYKTLRLRLEPLA